MISTLDDLLAQLGTGWWDVIHYMVLIFCLSLPASHALGGAFLAPNVDYTCVPTEPSALLNNDVRGHSSWMLVEAPNNSSTPNQCSYFFENSETGEVAEEICNEWLFDNSTFATTITSEFQLTCDRAYLRATYQSIYMSGMFIGALISGFVADSLGRKTTIVFGLLSFLILTNASCWVTNLSALLFFRFLLGIAVPFIANISYILVVEISEPRLRPHLGIISMLPWAFAMVIWGSVAYLIRHWRWLQFAVSIPGILVLPFLWLMDESPRWLAVTGRRDCALRVLKKAARLNRTTLPHDGKVLTILSESEQEKPEKQKQEKKEIKTIIREQMANLGILYRTPKLRLITLSLYGAYFIVNMGYYGLSLSGGNLSNNPFVFMILSGLMEVPAYSLTVPIVAHFGRRMPTLVSFALSGIALLAIAPTPSSCGWLIMTLAMIGKLCITSAYQILIFYSTELFPTEVRSRGVGTCFMMSRVGSIISPFINEILGSLYPWAPSAVFGSSAIVASLVMLILPETLGVALPDTVAELESRETQPQKRSWLRVPTSEKESREAK
ncbi:organic cation transporter protein-like [Palaemon carinicauda]|uniref:organic cation transporter protein-like n=1 Tax=Palaemon carinicauda TaxID=392227 RepID=UPI0035B5B554